MFIPSLPAELWRIGGTNVPGSDHSTARVVRIYLTVQVGGYIMYA
jgi:hypothetical protein